LHLKHRSLEVWHHCVSGVRGQRHGLSSISRLLQQSDPSTDRQQLQQQQQQQALSNGNIAAIDEAQSRDISGSNQNTADNPLTKSSPSFLESDFVISFDKKATVESSFSEESTAPDGGIARKQSKIKKQVAFNDPYETAEVHQADVDGESDMKITAVIGDQDQEEDEDGVTYGQSTNVIGRRGSKKRRSSRKKITCWKQHS